LLIIVREIALESGFDRRFIGNSLCAPPKGGIEL
jgi:hypothetical protein